MYVQLFIFPIISAKLTIKPILTPQVRDAMASGQRRIYKDVMKQMQNMIRSGAFPVGGRLPPERELAERFNVSRPTIREAIIALEALDLVSVKPGSGVYVMEKQNFGNSSWENISAYELTESRAMIEGETAALAAKFITDEELVALEAALQMMADENTQGDISSGDADRHFHHLIAKATRNAMMESIIVQMWKIRDEATHIAQAYNSICEQNGQQRIAEHQEIFDALKARDADAARTAMHHHFARILNRLINTMELEQVNEVKRKSSEVRKRFSLGHLVAQDD